MSKITKHGAALALIMGVAMGCLVRPVSVLEPTTKQSFAAVVKQQAVDKVDILFMVDNSASMGDKQDLFADAVPDLITRLINPDCVKDDLSVVPHNTDGTCPADSKEEFVPVYDMHIGIVSSSLGGGGATDVCNPADPLGKNPIPVLSNFDRHFDDKGHLLNRKKPSLTSPPTSGVEDPVQNALPKAGGGGNFLAWLPASNTKNQGKPQPNVTAYDGSGPGRDKQALVDDFKELIRGVQEYGCGLEAQMESWYRFLVQPDPWEKIQLNATCPQCDQVPKAELVGIDAEILKQRHDFLRPDSLVAIIVLTDEPDSWSDPLAYAGRGWTARTNNFPYSPTGKMPRETSACDKPVDQANPSATGPNDPSCTSCAFAGTLPNGQDIATDPNCQVDCSTPPTANNCKGYYTSKDDNLNVRYTSTMKQRYGLDPQFPLTRYVDGLGSLRVPNRTGEHPDGGGYVGTKNCTNPLFAMELPTDPNAELCKLSFGVRAPELVFFAVIGGVPWQLLLEDPKNAASQFKKELNNDDWRRILGKNPAMYQFDGIDPHMLESVLPRTAIVAGGADVTSADNADPIHGREWNTQTSSIGLDLQYACTFPLPKAKDCTLPEYKSACDCVGTATGAGGPPLCSPNGGGAKTLQTRGKAYPTIRELRVVQAVGSQGIVASLCPRVDAQGALLPTTSPDYGYRPAVRAIVDRLKNALAGQCLPGKLTRGVDSSVPCLVLISFPPGGAQATACDPAKGLKQPDPIILKHFIEQQIEVQGGPDAGITAASIGPVCELTQITSDKYVKDSCETLQIPGWCYVEGTATAGCLQAIKFSATGQPASGTKVSLQCIQASGG